MIIITSGVYGPKLLSRKDGPISLSPDEETRLVSLGIAQYANCPAETVTPDVQAAETPLNAITATVTSPKGESGSERATESESELVLADMSFVQLKDLANDMGIKPGNLRSKQALIEAIESERAPDLTSVEDVIA